MLATLCWGFWQNTYKVEDTIVDLKPFLDDYRGGASWDCESATMTTFLSREEVISIHGTFRHKECKRVNADGVPFDNFQCSKCASIPKEQDFCMRLFREKRAFESRGSRDTGGGRRLDFMTNSEILGIARSKGIVIRRLKKEIWFIRTKVAALSVKVRSLQESTFEAMERGDVRKFCYDIVNAHKFGLFEGKNALWNFLTDISQNIARVGQGKRYSKTTKDLFEAIKLWGGTRLHNFLSLNLEGPHLSTTMRATRKALCYHTGLREDVFKHVAEVYNHHMTKNGLRMGSVPVIIAEDETVVKRMVRWVARDDHLIGFCGKKEDHSCISNFVVLVGNGEDGYNRIMDSFQNNVLAHYARVLIANPLIECLPKLVILVQLTCNKFDSSFVKEQWEGVSLYWNMYVKNIVGPLIGHASDGDGRRRKLMLEDYTSSIGDRFSIPWKSWPFTACVENDGDISGLHDQDFIHNGKKLINPLDNASKRLVLGNDLVTLNHIAFVYQSFKVEEHGLQEGDVERKDRQNWRSAQRIAGRKVQNCLRLLRIGSDFRQERTLGTELYLSVVASYIDIFLSPTLNLYDRIKAAGRVSFFYRYFDSHVLHM